MKVQASQQSSQQKISLNQNRTPKFKGVGDSFLRYLATNQAVGANSVDFCFMVSPRTLSDWSKRGPAAGMETFRREVMGTVNDSLIGLFGAGAGWLIAFGIDKKFGLKANNIFTAPETLNILAENKAKQIKENKSQLDYIKETLRNVKAYNPTSKSADKEGFTRITEETIDEIAKMFDESLNKNVKFEDWTSKKAKNSRDVIMNKLTEVTGAQSQYVLESADKKAVSNTNLKSLLKDIYIVSDSFNKDKVKTAFDNQIRSNKGVKENAFIKDLSRFMKSRAGMGFAIASVIGLSVQPINMYLTKLKTGSDGFVGVEGRSKDTSAGFLGIKALSSAAFFSMILGTLGLSPAAFVKSPAKFMDKMAFNGKMPTINQLKGVYGVTIISRVFSARDKDELREVLTKDTLGYLSWLVLGDIVNKITADKFDKTVMNYKKGCTNVETKNIFKRSFHGALKTRDEILIETLANNGIKTTKEEGGKQVAKTFSEMLKDLDKLNNKALKKATRKRLSVLNGAQIAGYLFSGLVLGLGIPNLNIYITNKLDKKRKEEALKNVQAKTVA